MAAAVTATEAGASQLMKGEDQNLIVALRIRPMNEHEIIMGATPIAHRVDEKVVVLMDPMEDPGDVLRAHRTREKQYVFDFAFDGSSSQMEVYEKTSQCLIPSVISGYNATVFAYGATGAGKTYTMLGTEDNPGLMAHVLNDLFQEVEQCRQHSAISVSLSYLEIYNEMIRDLLNPESGHLDLREDGRGVQVAGLSELQAHNTHEVMEMLVRGNKERTQEPTKANQESSRSHAVLQVSVRQQVHAENLAHQVRTGKFFLIDLAGSERAANTQNRGKRLVEGAHINRSLLALGNCINALGTDKNKLKYVNYRDSKLTRILKDSLGGNSKTVMIAHISPANFFFEESRNTLLYADRAKNIKTKVRRNVTDISYHLSQYHHIIHDLKQEIKKLHQKLESSTNQRTALINAHMEEAEVEKREKKTNLERIRQQLLDSFSEQIELRRNLMDLNNSSMELSLDAYHNQMIIDQWGREREAAERRQSEEEEVKYRETEKPVNGEVLSGVDTPATPDEVRQAQDELSTVEEERERTEKMKEEVERELEQARDRAAQITQSLVNVTNESEHREILQLLCKVHELEISNLEMQSSCLLRNFEISKRDLALSVLHHHRTLAHSVIEEQRAAMDDAGMTSSPRLTQLYQAYHTALPDINTNAFQTNTKLGVTHRDSPSQRLTLPPLPTPQSVPRRHNVSKIPLKATRKDGKIFTLSPRAKYLHEIDPKLKKEPVSDDKANTRERSVITLTSSDRSTPSNVENQTTSDNMIAEKTRNIAHIAALRRADRAMEQHRNIAAKSLHNGPMIPNSRRTPINHRAPYNHSTSSNHTTSSNHSTPRSKEDIRRDWVSGSTRDIGRPRPMQDTAFYQQLSTGGRLSTNHSSSMASGPAPYRGHNLAPVNHPRSTAHIPRANVNLDYEVMPAGNKTRSDPQVSKKKKTCKNKSKSQGTRRGSNFDYAPSVASPAPPQMTARPTIPEYQSSDITVTGQRLQ